MRILAVSTWDTACGIANHTEMVKEAIEAADRNLQIDVHPEALDPKWALHWLRFNGDVRVVWLNHHDGLHSQWRIEHLEALHQLGIKVLVTYHDTRETLDPDSKLASLVAVADYIVVHEPIAGLTNQDLTHVSYIRQGVPDLHGVYLQDPSRLGNWPRPLLGTVGWNFPWKNYDRLCQVTAELGWGLLLLCNNASLEDIARWKSMNPYVIGETGFLTTRAIVSKLAGCTATAFMYECANTGTSGAIRLGIAARKPVYALIGCRQFRDLLIADEKDTEGNSLINWMTGWQMFKDTLVQSWPVDIDPAMVYLAERDSLRRVGQGYATILGLLEAR